MPESRTLSQVLPLGVKKINHTLIGFIREMVLYYAKSKVLKMLCNWGLDGSYTGSPEYIASLVIQTGSPTLSKLCSRSIEKENPNLPFSSNRDLLSRMSDNIRMNKCTFLPVNVLLVYVTILMSVNRNLSMFHLILKHWNLKDRYLMDF